MKKIIFILIYTSHCLGNIVFSEKNIIFENTVTIENNCYSGAPLKIKTLSNNSNAKINGNIYLNELNIGNNQEKSIIFLFGIPYSSDIIYHLTIDEKTGVVYKNSIKKEQLYSTDIPNIYQSVLTNKIQSSNKNTLFIHNTNNTKDKINIFFNSDSLEINANIFFINNLNGKNNILSFKRPIKVTESVLIEDLINNNGTLITKDIKIENKKFFNIEATNNFNIKNIKEKNIEIIAENITVENNSDTSSYSFTNLAEYSSGYCCTLNGKQVQKIKKENVSCTIYSIESNKPAMTFICDNMFLTTYMPSDFFMFYVSPAKALGINIDSLSLPEKFILNTSNLYFELTRGILNLTILNGSVENLLFDSSVNPKKITVNMTANNLTAKDVNNFNNEIKATIKTVIDGELYIEAQPLPSFTDYILISELLLPKGNNILPFSRPQAIPSLKLKKITNVEKLKSKNTYLSNKNNVFFNLIILVHNIYKKLDLENRIIRKLQKKMNEYTIQEDNFYEQVKIFLSQISKLIEYKKKFNTVEKKSKIEKEIKIINQYLAELEK